MIRIQTAAISRAPDVSIVQTARVNLDRKARSRSSTASNSRERAPVPFHYIVYFVRRTKYMCLYEDKTWSRSLGIHDEILTPLNSNRVTRAAAIMQEGCLDQAKKQ